VDKILARPEWFPPELGPAVLFNQFEDGFAKLCRFLQVNYR